MSPDILRGLTIRLQLPDGLSAQALEAAFWSGALTGGLVVAVALIVLYLWKAQ